MKELIERLKNKDDEALKKVMKMYKNEVYNYICLMMGHKEIARDITQDTFVKVYFKIHTLRSENLRTWIFKIATNLARTELRKLKIKKIFSISEISDSEYLLGEDCPDNEIIAEQILARLPEKPRSAIIMKEIYDFTLEEIAVILNKPVSTVKSMVFRGFKQIRAAEQPQKGGIYGKQEYGI